jgi:Family of unknown function (DUF6261)
MKTVNPIYYYKLDNGDFYQFIENMVTIVAKEPLAATVVAPLIAIQPVLLSSFKKELLTQETKQIVALDKFRDRAYTRLRYLLIAYTFDDQNSGFVTAANKIETFVAQHGNAKLISFDYNKETASISSLIVELRAHASKELDLLQLRPVLDFLELSNNTFKEFYGTRGDAASVLANVPPFYKLRKQAGDDYKTMITDLESLQRFVPASATQIADLITRINVEIDKFKLLVPNTPAPGVTPNGIG